jgi:hypothetical protein
MCVCWPNAVLSHGSYPVFCMSALSSCFMPGYQRHLCNLWIWNLVRDCIRLPGWHYAVEEIEDRRQRRPLGYSCISLICRRPEAISVDARKSIANEAGDPRDCFLIDPRLPQVVRQACMRDFIEGTGDIRKQKTCHLTSFLAPCFVSGHLLALVPFHSA